MEAHLEGRAARRPFDLLRSRGFAVARPGDTPRLAPMNCPACGNVLGNLVAGNVALDVCRSGCGGVWFDNFELKRIDETARLAGSNERANQWRPKRAE